MNTGSWNHLLDVVGNIDPPLLIGVLDDGNGKGRQFTRQPSGTIKVEFVTIDKYPVNMPNLWPDFAQMFGF